jgi:RNase P/RNase MRP subunit POP5
MNTRLNQSMRAKKRYLLLNSIPKKDIEKAILDYIGILGWAKAEPNFVSLGNKIILAVSRKEVENVRAAFEASNLGIKVLKVSGTLKGVKK